MQRVRADMTSFSCTLVYTQGLPEYHPIVQMLWDKSRTAAKQMEGEEDILERLHG